MRKGEQGRNEMIKDMNCQILQGGVDARRRWDEHFEQVLMVDYIREANINVVGDTQMPV